MKTCIYDDEGNILLQVSGSLTQPQADEIAAGLEAAFKRGTVAGKEVRSIEIRQLIGAAAMEPLT